MDDNVRARDERIQELSELLDRLQARGITANSNAAADLQRSLNHTKLKLLESSSEASRPTPMPRLTSRGDVSLIK
jgi:hypothetical protein